ncbi:MAG: hypothetical protein M0P55_15170 [Clostridiales bacterium]|nr:hypothetical protein [Clostridiales bacterium]
MNLLQLQKAGYPLRADDLTLEEWYDLGRVRAALEQPAACPLMGRKQ